MKLPPDRSWVFLAGRKLRRDAETDKIEDVEGGKVEGGKRAESARRSRCF